MLGVRACEVLEIVPLFEDFLAELPFKMAINMKIIGVLLYQTSEETAVLASGIEMMAKDNNMGVLNDFIEARASG